MAWDPSSHLLLLFFAEDEAESLRLAEKREITDMEAVFSGDYPSAEPSIEGAAARERQGLKWCPGPLRSLAVSWVWFLLMMLSLLAALVVFLVWLHTGYHTFAQQHIGLQLLLTAMTVVVLLLERQIVNLVRPPSVPLPSYYAHKYPLCRT